MKPAINEASFDETEYATRVAGILGTQHEVRKLDLDQARDVIPKLLSQMSEPLGEWARRAIAGGGAYLNNVRVTAPDAVPSMDDLLHGRFLVIRRGKRTACGVEVVRG